MVCIQAHNDDFDISLSGIARKYDTVIIVTVMDSGTGHYDFARQQGLIPDDMVVNQSWISPEGNEWTQDFHSESLSEYRIGIMEDRYDHFQYTSIRPDIRVPDAITYNASLEIQHEYLRHVGQEIATKLQAQDIADYDLFIHDPELPDHLDHELSGKIGSTVCRLFPPRSIYYFYVYTIDKLPNYEKINVEEHLDHKNELFSMVWEREDLPMQMWKKYPPDFDEFFRDEVLITGDKLDEGDIEWSWWLPILIWLRKVRIWLGIS